MNYAFDESEFVRKVDEAANLVIKHRVFREVIFESFEDAEGANEKCALPGDWNIDIDYSDNEMTSVKLVDEL